MQTEQLTLEEFLILLDAADTQLTNKAARVIRELKLDLEMAHIELDYIKENFEELK